VFVVDGLDNPTEVTLLVTELREDGLRAERAYGGRSFKAQMKVADRAGARYAVLLGAREAARGAVGVRDMVSHEQIEVPRQLVAGWLQERLENPGPREVEAPR
jgi:histidyl-tRNA synthetase